MVRRPTRSTRTDTPFPTRRSSELQMLLLEAVRERVGADRIHAGWHLTDWREEGGNIVASFVDKKSDASRGEVTGALLIGADGIHSTLRRRLYQIGRASCRERVCQYV